MKLNAAGDTTVIRVLYDISRLGECHQQPHARTGLARVIENVASGLVDAKECEVSFCAAESYGALEGATDYLAQHPRLNSTPLLRPRKSPLKEKLNARLREINAELAGLELRDAPGNAGVSQSLNRFRVRARIERRLIAQLGAVEYERPFDPRWLRSVDIFHSPFHALPQSATRAARFLTVYDLIPILYPQFCVASQIQFSRELLQSIRPSDWVLCISAATMNDLCNYTGIDPGRVAVTYLAAEPDLFYPCDDAQLKAAVRRQYRIPDGPYVLSINTLEPRKNLEQVVRCFAKIVREQNIADLNLVLAGAQGWLAEALLAEISSYADLRDRIIMTGYVSDEHLAPLYSDALGFLFLSHYEGFGLPALEAMQCGVPVIASNVSSIPEVVGEAGRLCEPNDTEACCQALLDLYRSSALRESMAKKSLARAAEFSWEKCVQQTISAYHRSLA